MSATGFEGSTLEYRFVSPVMPGSDAITLFTEQPGQDAEFLISGDFDVGAFNVDNKTIRFDMNSSFGISFAPGDAFTISDIGIDDVPDIVGFTLSTNVAGLTAANITYTAQSFTITMPGSLDWLPGQYLEITAQFITDTQTPDPDPRPDPQPTKVTGTDGDDFLRGSGGQDIMAGGGGNDALFAGGGNDTVNGGTGDDTIGGGNHADVLYGEQGNDIIYAGEGNDAAYGGIGNDALFGGGGHDSLYGGDGRDTVWGGSGNDLLKGANGDDVLGGGAGNDEVFGGAGNDTVSGGDGNDQLFGNMGNDVLFGGAGKDTIDGGLGNDNLYGGGGADTFVFGKAEGNDVIRDFEADRDFIKLSGQTYTVGESANGDAILELSGGGTVTLIGVAIGDVNSDWFLTA